MKNQHKLVLACALLASAPLSFADCLDALSKTNPDASFSVSEGDQPTVTHLVTGLVWARCSLGQSWNAAENTCGADGSATRFTWDAALAAAEQADYAGTEDWRLPNKKELASLIEFGCFAPAVNSSVFPATFTDSAYWTSTPLPPGFSPAAAWMVDFAQGSFTSSARTAELHVRLVRAGD